MPLINCEINLILTWSEDCVSSSATEERKTKIPDTKIYSPLVKQCKTIRKIKIRF